MLTCLQHRYMISNTMLKAVMNTLEDFIAFA